MKVALGFLVVLVFVCYAQCGVFRPEKSGQISKDTSGHEAVVTRFRRGVRGSWRKWRGRSKWSQAKKEKKKKKAAVCPEGWLKTRNPKLKKCVLIETTPKTYQDATEFCQSKEGKLLVINSTHMDNADESVSGGTGDNSDPSENNEETGNQENDGEQNDDNKDDNEEDVEEEEEEEEDDDVGASDDDENDDTSDNGEVVSNNDGDNGANDDEEDQETQTQEDEQNQDGQTQDEQDQKEQEEDENQNQEEEQDTNDGSYGPGNDENDNGEYGAEDEVLELDPVLSGLFKEQHGTGDSRKKSWARRWGCWVTPPDKSDEEDRTLCKIAVKAPEDEPGDDQTIHVRIEEKACNDTMAFACVREMTTSDLSTDKGQGGNNGNSTNGGNGKKGKKKWNKGKKKGSKKWKKKKGKNGVKKDKRPKWHRG